MVYATNRTIYNIRIQNALLFGLDYTPLPNTTLNEKFNILPRYPLTDLTPPTINLLTLGVGGTVLMSSNETTIRRSQHSSKDAALFNHLPLVIRRIDNDLDDVTRQKYRLRRIENINGIQYICYYAKRINKPEQYDNVYVIKDDNISVFDTKTSPDVLNPTPVGSLDFSTITPEYLLNKTELLIEFDSNEILELQNAMSIKYPGQDLQISELALCSSKDVTINGYTEAVWTEINYFVDVELDLNISMHTSDTVEFYIEVGGSEPLYSS